MLHNTSWNLQKVLEVGSTVILEPDNSWKDDRHDLADQDEEGVCVKLTTTTTATKVHHWVMRTHFK
jgi:hypothetical protein